MSFKDMKKFTTVEAYESSPVYKHVSFQFMGLDVQIFKQGHAYSFEAYLGKALRFKSSYVVGKGDIYLLFLSEFEKYQKELFKSDLVSFTELEKELTKFK